MYPSLGHFIFPVYTYGVFLSMAFLSAIILAIFQAPKIGIKASDITDLAILFMLSAMAGARGLYIILYPQQFPTIYSWFEFNKGGLVFFGGFLVTVITVVAFAYYRSINLRDLGDLIAPSLITGQAVGRLGCFMNGCCFGKPTGSFLGMVFPNLNDQIARHPTQLYESASMFILLILTESLLRKRMQNREARQNIAIRAICGHAAIPGRQGIFPGAVWGVYCISYGIIRFCIEIIRDDDRGGFFTPIGFSISQIIGIVAAIGGLIWLYYCRKISMKEIQMENGIGK